MPRAAKLKVYRTAIGFHDAYVAASSQKAALKAWGSDKDLFARGAAELVEDPSLTAGPLASAGEVIKLLRGTEEEQIAALPPDKPKAPVSSSTHRTSKAAAKTKPKPRPSRSALDAAEIKIAKIEETQGEAMKALAAREAKLAKERRSLEQAQAEQRGEIQEEHDRAAADYERAMQKWKA